MLENADLNDPRKINNSSESKLNEVDIKIQ